MDHSVSLISTIAFGFGLALIFGFIATKLKIPALVGYLFAGILIGPTTPGFVADMTIAAQLSEIGVMLLMFGVGLHFSLEDLLSVRRVAIPGAVIQMSVATLLGMGMAIWWGYSFGAALIFGVSLSCASTVVLLKALEAKNILESMNGRIAVGWLVMEDLATVLVLVLLPPLANLLGGNAPASHDQSSLFITVGQTLLQVIAFIVITLFVGKRVIPWCIWQVSRTGSRELFTLSVIAVAVSIAYGASELFGVSFALGAFFAGMVLRESEFSHRAAEKSLPLRDAFAVLFFVAVGMLFQPQILITKPLEVLCVVAIIILGKSLAAALLVLALRYPLHTALTVAASLAQIGEFSFILASLGMTLGLLPQEGYSLILAGAIISITLNPFIFNTLTPISRWILKHSAYARHLDARKDPSTKLPENDEPSLPKGHVVLVGYGRVGKRISEALKKQNLPYMIVEQNRTLVESLRHQGFNAISGDATDADILHNAHIHEAAMLIIATPDAINVRKIAEVSRSLNPTIELILRTHSEDEASLLQSDNIGTVFFGEEELAKGMTNHVLLRFIPQH